MRIAITLLLILLFGSIIPGQVDWSYIDRSNANALDAFIKDHTTAAKFQAPENRGCCHSWSSGKDGYNCTNYGVALWVLREAIRTENSAAFNWLADHARHVMNYGYYWGGLNPKRAHHPGGEGVRTHPVWLQTHNDDSDRLRHVHLAPYCAIYACKQVPLTPAERLKLRSMILDWADNWYMKVNWYDMRDKGKLFEYGRGMVPALGLISTFYITGNRKYLRAAQYIFACTFYGFEREVHIGYQKPPFYAYDTGYEGEGRTRRLTDFAAHFNQEPWQMGFTAEVAFHLHFWTRDVNVRHLIQQVMLRVTDWVVRPDVPMGDLAGPGDRGVRLSFLQGGSQIDLYRFQMTPEQALILPDNQPFYPLVLLHAHLWDGGYWVRFLPNLTMRYHYPRYNSGQPVGPVCSHAIMYNWADMMLVRYLLTGKRSDLLWTLWVYRDSKYFANRSSVSDSRKLSKPDFYHYGTGNIGKTRGFAWWARGSLMSRGLLKFLTN